MPISHKLPRAVFVALALAGLTAVMVLLGGCPGTLENKEQFQSTGQGASQCPDTPMFLAQKCATVGCHNSMTQAGSLNLESSGLEERVGGKPSAGCSGAPLADPDDPDSSMLFRKLTADPGCGLRMPFGQPALTDAEIDCVREWISTLEAGPVVTDAGTSDADTADAADDAN